MLRRFIDNSGRIVRLPVHEIERVSKYQKLVNDCLLLYGEKPPKEYMCYKLRISEKALENLERTVYTYNSIQSLDEPYGEDGSMSIHETIAGDSNVEDEVIEKCMKELPDVWDSIEDFLPEKEFEVVCMRYNGHMTLEAVGEHIGISRERVRQLESAGIRHLRYPRTLRAIAERYDEFIMTKRNNNERERRAIY